MAGPRWTALDLPNLAGRSAVVTGASGGLGEVVAGELARAGATVTLAVRDLAKGRAAAARISGRADVRRLDLADLASVRAFAADWTGDLDILVNNAGIMQVPHSLTRDGFELQMGTNYLGPFALTVALLPHVRSRVVTVSSQLQSAGHIHLEDLNGEHRHTTRCRPTETPSSPTPCSPWSCRAGSLKRAVLYGPSPQTRASLGPAWPRTSAAPAARCRNSPSACSTTRRAALPPRCMPRPQTSPQAPTSDPTAFGTYADTPR